MQFWLFYVSILIILTWGACNILYAARRKSLSSPSTQNLRCNTWKCPWPRSSRLLEVGSAAPWRTSRVRGCALLLRGALPTSFGPELPQGRRRRRRGVPPLCCLCARVCASRTSCQPSVLAEMNKIGETTEAPWWSQWPQIMVAAGRGWTWCG